MGTIDLNDKPVKNESCRMEELDDEVLLYNPENSKTLYINKSASIIWQLCNGQQTVEEIIGLIQEAYPGNDEQLHKDVLDTLSDLKENNAVSIA